GVEVRNGRVLDPLGGKVTGDPESTPLAEWQRQIVEQAVAQAGVDPTLPDLTEQEQQEADAEGLRASVVAMVGVLKTVVPQLADQLRTLVDKALGNVDVSEAGAELGMLRRWEDS